MVDFIEGACSVYSVYYFEMVRAIYGSIILRWYPELVGFMITFILLNIGTITAVCFFWKWAKRCLK